MENKVRIRTDSFTNDVREQFPEQFGGRSNDEILNFFEKNIPGLSDNFYFYDLEEPSEWEKISSGFRTLGAKSPVIVDNIAGNIKESIRLDQTDHEKALKYKRGYERDRIPISRRSRSGLNEFKGLSRSQVDKMSFDEIDDWYTKNIAEDDKRREVDAKNHELLVKEADARIKNNPKIQAVQEWYAENPVEGFLDWWKPENIAFGIGEFASSYVPIVGSAVVGGLTAGPVGAAAAAGSMGYALEAGNHFDTAYEVAKNELKLDDATAYKLASESSHYYGLISAMLESIAPTLAVKSMLLPKSATNRFFHAMMSSSNKTISQLGKKLSPDQVSDAMKMANANSYALFGKLKQKFIKEGGLLDAIVDNPVTRTTGGYVVNRFSKGKLTEAGLEAITEASQYLAEEAMLDGYVRHEDIPDYPNWLKEKMSTQEFKDSFMMGTYAILSPLGGGGTGKGTGYSTKLSDGKDVVVTDNNDVLVGEDLNPIENKRWEPVEDDETDEKTSTFVKEQDTMVERLTSYVDDDPTNIPQAKEDGSKIENLGAALLDEVKKGGWESIIALEHHTVGDEKRSKMLQMLGHALIDSDDTGIFNIRIDKNEIVNEDDVLMTLRGVIHHGVDIQEQESGALGTTISKQVATITNNNMEKPIRENFKNPSNFASLNIAKLAEKQAVDEARKKSEKVSTKPPNNKNTFNNPIGQPNSINNRAELENKNREQNRMDESPEGDQLKKFEERIRKRYIDLHQEGDTEKAKEGILKLDKDKFRKFVKKLGLQTEGLETNKDGEIKASKKNKELIWKQFSEQMDEEIEIYNANKDQLSLGENESRTNNIESNPSDNTDGEVTSNTNTDEVADKQQTNANPNDDTHYGDDGEGYDDSFSQVQLKEDEEVQPFAYEEGVATPETVELTKRLNKHFPEIQSQTLQQVVDNEGNEVAGKAFSNIVQWSEDKSRIDDMPHEYFHIYLDTFSDSPIIKEGLRRFTKGAESLSQAKEQFTELIGNYYANRIKDKSLMKKLKVWVRQAWLHFKKRFGKLSKQDYVDLVGEQFFKGARPSDKKMTTTPKAVYYSDSEVTLHDEAEDQDGAEEQVQPIDNLKGNAGVSLTNVFFSAFGTYIPKTYLAVNLPSMAKEYADYDEFRGAMLDDIMNQFNGTIENEYKFEEAMKTLYLQNRSRVNIAKVKMNNEFVTNDKGEIVKDKNGNKIPKVINIDPAKGRIRYEMIFVQKPNSKKFHSLDVQFDTHHIKRGKKNPQSFVQNFIELQDDQRGDKVRFMYLPLKNIFKHVTKKDGSKYWTDNTRYDFRLGGRWVQAIDKIFMRKFINKESPVLPFFFSTKAGDNSQMILGVVPHAWVGSAQPSHRGKEIDVRGIDRDFFTAELTAQIEMMNITKAQARQMLDDADALAKEKIQGDSDSTVGNLAYAINLGHHIRWQQVKGNNYMHPSRAGKNPDGSYKDRSLMDIVNRLRSDFAEGITPYGAGERKILWMNTDEIIITGPDQDGNEVEWDRKRPFGDDNDGEDGVLYTGGHYLSKIGNAFGMGSPAEIKTAIRHISNESSDPNDPGNLHNYTDYIISKHMEETPMPGMKIYKKDSNGVRESTPFIEVVGQGRQTKFKVLKGDQEGMEFDTFGTNNEIKDSSGKYSQTGIVHALPEEATKVMTKSKSASTAAHPVNVHEMLMDDYIMESKEGQEYLNALSEYIDEAVEKNMDMLYNFRTNPKSLRDYLFKDLKTGEIPSELQTYVNMDETGNVLKIPSVLSQVLSMLNNRIVSGGMMRLRTSNGRGTKLYLKPKGNLNIEDRSVIVSAGNSTMLNLVEKAYIKSLGVNSQGEPRFVEWVGETKAQKRHDKIKTLNEWLANNEYLTLIHRQPIQGATKVEPRRIQQFLEGHHGNTIFMSPDDVFVLHEADFDGDTVFMERPENKRLINAMDNLSKTGYFKERSKIVGLGIFKQGETESSVASRGDRGDFYYRNANSMFAQGLAVNGRTTAATMAFKNLSFSDNSLPENVRYEVNKPGDSVVMDYIELDAQALISNQELWNLITEVNGDEVVMRKSDAIPDFKIKKGEDPWIAVRPENLKGLAEKGFKIHLRTSFENEMSNLLQMAVDNVKNGIMSQFNFNGNFMMQRIFKRTDGKPISKEQAQNIKNVYSVFQYSSTRRGKGKYQQQLSMHEMITEFSDMRNRYYRKGSTALQTKADIVDNITNEIYADFKTDKPSWQLRELDLDHSRITPMEKLLTQPDIYNDRLNEDIARSVGSTPLNHLDGQYRYAHVESVKMFDKAYENQLNIWKSTDPQKGLDAINFAQEMADEFYDILGKRAEESGTEVEQMQGIKYDLTEDFTTFTEKWMDKFNSLDEMQQIISTVYFLSGTEHYNLNKKKTKKGFVMKLLPLPLMHQGVIKEYAKEFNNQLQTEKKIRKKDTKKTRYNFRWSEFQQKLEDKKCI